MNKIINFTPTGTQTTRDNSLAPLLPNEIIEEVHSANEVGISIVHLHARDEETKNTYKKEVYQKIIEGIKKHCPELLICVSLTGRNFPELEKRSEVLQLLPDMGSLTMSSLNFPSGASINQPNMILSLIDEMNNYGVQPEIECFDTGHLQLAIWLKNQGLIDDPVMIQLCMGIPWGAPDDMHTFLAMTSSIPKDWTFSAFSISRNQLPFVAMSILAGGNIRVGLEDNIYLKKGVLATNGDLVKQAVKTAEGMGCTIIGPEQVRKNLKLEKRWG